MASSIHLPNRPILVGIWLLALLSGSIAAAAGKESPEVQAREQFRLGQKAYDEGKFDDALKAFSEAYGLQPTPAFLFNIAQCHRNLGNYERAGVFYQQYLELSRSSENAAAVRALLSEVQAADKEEKRKAAEQEALRQKQLNAAKLAAAAPVADRRHDLGLKEASASASGRSPEVAKESGYPIFKKWWFWTGIGVIAAGTTAYFVASHHSADPTLGNVNVR